MGITNHGYRFILSRQGVKYTRTVMIGRHQLFLDERDLAVRGITGVTPTGYADDLFRHLGAEVVDSIDASPYEGATIVHDMNEPIARSLHGRYTAVVDSGSLEHIFNFPVAVANCMNLVRPGGHLLLIAPANNQLGHGFYQFSPELFFRVLSPAYGFEPPQVLVKDSRRHSGPWLEVQDPARIGGRAELVSHRVQYLYIQARRTDDRAVDFSTAPQQSDYVAAWAGGAARPDGRCSLLRAFAQRTGLARVSAWYDPLVGISGRRPPDPLYFRRVTP
jgi:hypothetical protein